LYYLSEDVVLSGKQHGNQPVLKGRSNRKKPESTTILPEWSENVNQISLVFITLLT